MREALHRHCSRWLLGRVCTVGALTVLVAAAAAAAIVWLQRTSNTAHRDQIRLMQLGDRYHHLDERRDDLLLDRMVGKIEYNHRREVEGVVVELDATASELRRIGMVEGDFMAAHRAYIRGVEEAVEVAMREDAERAVDVREDAEHATEVRLHRPLDGYIERYGRNASRTSLLANAGSVVSLVIALLVIRLMFVRLGEATRREHEAERERIKAEAESERLRDSDALKDEFISHVSHELRTPLTSIRGYVEMLADGTVGDLSETQRDFLGRVDRNAGRLLTIVNDLLLLAQSDAGRFTIARERVSPVAVVAASVDSLRQQAATRGLSVSVDTDPVPDVIGDPERLGQVVDNLVSNAIKYTPEGGSVRVGVRGDGDRVRIDVADTGTGIPATSLPHLFDRFYRVAGDDALRITGAGLGLAIVSALVEAHGGEIAVESVEGVGSTFTVLLPVPSDAAASEQRACDPVTRAAA